MSPDLPPISPLFLERMSRLLGDEFPAFAAALAGEPVHGLRVNTLKLSAEAFRGFSPFPLGDKVPWCDSAYTLTPDPSPEGRGESFPGKHPYHLAGLYYLQDPSAMSAAELLAPKAGERVLDLAASPGGKTTHLAALLDGRGLLVANEIRTKRLDFLAVNVQRWGAGNVVVTNESPERLADHFGAAFDRVLVDAPCSGEGTFRRDAGARRDWSLEAVGAYAGKQSNILRVAAHLVRPGGTLLYSTCTFAPEEDEGTLARFLEAHAEFEVVALPQLPGFAPGHPEWLGRGDVSVAPTLRGAVRLFPHRVSGDGHFVCLLQRIGGEADDRSTPWTPVPLSPAQAGLWCAFREETLAVDFPEERLYLQGGRLYLVPEGMPEMRPLRVALPGVWLGTFKKDRFEPAHPLALTLRRGQAKNVLDLPAEGREIGAYLRGGTIPSAGQPGWVLVAVDGWPLGWGKRVQGVVKNHYPRGWLAVS